MHPTSLENMARCWSRYVDGAPLGARDRLTVLDMGAADVNGSYRKIVTAKNVEYLAVDLKPGEGVDVVLDDPYKLPFDDRSIDIVISGQMLEHCEYFWLSFVEMMRVVHPDGYLFLIAPSSGGIHRFPVDCYRFHPDAYHALARYAGCKLVEVWHDQRGAWKDLVGVFSWRQDHAPRRSRQIAQASTWTRGSAPDPQEEATRGSVAYLDCLAKMHERLAPELYLEIGVRTGASLALAQGPAIGVDPAPNLKVELPESAKVVEMLSDDFFEDCASEHLPTGPDLVFIDGMHHFEYALRDFMNVEQVAAAGAVVVVDDVLPNHPAQALRQRRTGVWTGDVWKLYVCLKRERPDLFLALVDANPTGLLLIWGLDARSTRLWQRYNTLIKDFVHAEMPTPDELIERQDVVDPEALPRILDEILAIRTENLQTRRALPRLRAAAGMKEPAR